MRRVVVDLLRRRGAARRGGRLPFVVYSEETPDPRVPELVDWLAVDEALLALESVDARCARVVELKFFSGLTTDENRRGRRLVGGHGAPAMAFRKIVAGEPSRCREPTRMTSSATAFHRLRTAFESAIEAPDRERYLAELSRTDPTLAQKVVDLLHADDQVGDALTIHAMTNDRSPHERPPSVVGPYAVFEELGRGGMGVVYRAERTGGPVEQQVAIKVLHRSTTDPVARRRFEVECQALAHLDHPGIARLIEPLELPDGRPCLVMELVRGRPITEYCEKHALAVRERLRLFRGVCEAAARGAPRPRRAPGPQAGQRPRGPTPARSSSWISGSASRWRSISAMSM